MSLNNIQLKPRMIADLYPHSLIGTAHAAAKQSKPVKFLGDNQKKIIIIVSHPSVPVIPDTELTFLTSVLSACKLTLMDIALVNFAALNPDDLHQLIKAEGERVLLFGMDPLSIGLPVNFPAFQLQQFDKRMYLHAPGLQEIEMDKALKTRLWTSLKSMFGL